MSKHICEACVVCCIDFRFQKYIRQWTDKNLENKKFDLIGFAGATKSLDIILSQIDISVRLHETKEIILIHHEECGAYGQDSTHERHETDLQKAKNAVLEKYPNLSVRLFYLHLDGNFEEIK